MNLTSLVCKHFKTEPGTETYEAVFTYCASYLSGGYTAFELQHLLKPFRVGLSPVAFRLRLLKYKRIQFGLKLFLLNLSMIVKPTGDDIRRLLKEIDVDREDARQVYNMWVEQPKFRYRLQKTARRINRVADLSEAGILELFQRMYPALMSYAKSITYRKLRFIAKSTNLELDDLQGDIMLKVVQAFYRLCPSDKGEAYVTNYLRRAAHNHAMNLIKANTTQKRGRLIMVGRDKENIPTFNLTVMSENQIRALNESGEPMSYEDMGKPDSQMEKFELSFSVSQILDKYKARSRKYKFLTILMGHEDKVFTEWLRARHYCGLDDTNTDVQLEKTSDEFLRLLCKFMHIGQDSANVFLLKVGNELGYKHDTHRSTRDRIAKVA